MASKSGVEPGIIVVGSNMVDLASYLNRFPEEGETVFGQSFAQGFGGKGANQAVMASLLGVSVDLVTCVGDDLFGPGWFSHLKAFGVCSDNITTIAGTHSGVAVILVEADGRNRIVLGSGANEFLTTAHVDAAFENNAAKPWNVVLSQLEAPQEAIARGFNHAKTRDAITILNPGPASPISDEIMQLTDWLLPNETELRLLAVRMFDLTSDNDIDLAQQFAERTKKNLVVTLGSDGAVLVSADDIGNPRTFPAPAVDVVDTTGAGDAFAGGFAFGISAGMPVEETIQLAVAVSADSVKRHGTAVSYAAGEALASVLSESGIRLPS